jgi:hypothetical protein
METRFGSQKWENPQIMNPSIYEVSIWNTFLNNQAIYRVVQQGQDLNLIFNKKIQMNWRFCPHLKETWFNIANSHAKNMQDQYL